MRVALIATGERGAEPAPIVAGRSLVLRQLDFARACGVERVIAYGNGVREDAQALRQAAERARLPYTAIASAHALVALVDWGDELLVIQPGLLPEARSAIDSLERGGKVLAFPAAEQGQERLERIDAASTWAGALVLPGAIVDRLEQLPEDADPHAALLRIALQARLTVEHLPPALLADGRWARLLSNGDAAALQATRLRRLGGGESLGAPSRKLAGLALTRWAEPLADRFYAPALALLLALLLLLGSPLAAWLGWPALAFAALALGVPVLHLARMLDRLGRAAFKPPRIPIWLRHLPDAALFTAVVFSVEGAWYRQLFPPLVLLIALHRIGNGSGRMAWIGDRAPGTLFVALGALLGAHEPALMAWALLALIAGRGWTRPERSAGG